MLVIKGLCFCCADGEGNLVGAGEGYCLEGLRRGFADVSSSEHSQLTYKVSSTSSPPQMSMSAESKIFS